MDCREHVRGRGVVIGRGVSSNISAAVRRSVETAIDEKRIERYFEADPRNGAALNALKSFDECGSARNDDGMPHAEHRRSQ